VSVNRISLELFLLGARVSAVQSLTFFGLEMQKISLNISLKEAHIGKTQTQK